MTSRRILWTVALAFCILVQFSQCSQAYRPVNHACCVKYTRKPLPFHLIKGYVVQSSLEICRMDAIIFVTMRNQKVCASPEHDWVKTTISCLSEKVDRLKKNGAVEDLTSRECWTLRSVNGSATKL